MTGPSRGQWFSPSWFFHSAAWHSQLPSVALTLEPGAKADVKWRVQSKIRWRLSRAWSNLRCISPNAISLGKVYAWAKCTVVSTIRRHTHTQGGIRCGRKACVGWSGAVSGSSCSLQGSAGGYSAAAPLPSWDLDMASGLQGTWGFKCCWNPSLRQEFVASNRVCDVLIGRNEGNWSYW